MEGGLTSSIAGEEVKCNKKKMPHRVKGGAFNNHVRSRNQVGIVKDPIPASIISPPPPDAAHVQSRPVAERLCRARRR